MKPSLPVKEVLTPPNPAAELGVEKRELPAFA